jgi:hypothetical protein
MDLQQTIEIARGLPPMSTPSWPPITNKNDPAGILRSQTCASKRVPMRDTGVKRAISAGISPVFEEAKSSDFRGFSLERTTGLEPADP